MSDNKTHKSSLPEQERSFAQEHSGNACIENTRFRILQQYKPCQIWKLDSNLWIEKWSNRTLERREKQ